MLFIERFLLVNKAPLSRVVSDKIHSFLSSDSTGRVCSHFFDSVIQNIPSSGLPIPISS